MSPKQASGEDTILAAMKKHDKFIGDILAPFEKSLGMKFNKFNKPEDPKYVEPKKKANLKMKLKVAERKQQRLKKMDKDKVKEVLWKKALDKAQGVKIKDDPKMIKKAIKRKEGEKKKHKKKWAERVEKQEEAKQMKEKKKKSKMDARMTSKTDKFKKKGKKGKKAK